MRVAGTASRVMQRRVTDGDTTTDYWMTSRARTVGLAALLAAIASVLYFNRLADAPIYLTRDETFIGLTGQSLASKGRDLQGQFMPLYLYSHAHANWWTPMLPYATAAVLEVLPFSEGTVRAPMAIAAVVNVVLVFLVGRLLFRRDSLAFVPALLLAMTPAHFIENRYANDSGLPATFALGWALAALLYFRSGNPRTLFVAGLMLGLGFYSYVGAAPLMPLYMALTAVALVMRRERAMRYAAFALGCALPIAAGIPWLMSHPEVFQTTFLHYQNEQMAGADTVTGLRMAATVGRVADIATLYVQFWNPRVLFVHGAPTLMHSTGRAGVFLVAMAGLLLVGIVRAGRHAASDPRLLLVLGAFLLAPVPASLVDINDHTALHATWRAVAVAPFGALLAGVALEYLLTRPASALMTLASMAALAAPYLLIVLYPVVIPNRAVMIAGFAIAAAIAVVPLIESRLMRGGPSPIQLQNVERWPPAFGVAVVLGIACLVQFSAFHRDYMTDYRRRFLPETDGNVRDVLEAVIERSPQEELSPRRAVPAIYLGFRFGAGEWGSYYWLFYLHKHHREDLLVRTINDANASQFTRERICHLPAGSIAATRAGWDKDMDALIDRMMKNGDVTLERLVGGEPTYWLLRTTGACG